VLSDSDIVVNIVAEALDAPRCSALEDEDSRTEAVEAIRALIETIIARTRGRPPEDHTER